MPSHQAQPYHQPGAPGHVLLQPVGDRDDDERRRGRWRPPPWNGHDWNGHDWNGRDWNSRGPSWGHWGPGHPPGWGSPGHGHHQQPHFAPRPLPGWVVEHRLRQQSFRPFGRIAMRNGVYLVSAFDPRGRRVLLVVDPLTAVILGRQRHH
jgi:hypothetical protein